MSVLARRVARISRTLRATRPEMKYNDTYSGGTSVTSILQYQQLCGITQGDANYQRDGNQIIVRKINVRGLINAAAEENGLCKIWIALVYVNDPDLGATPVETEIFDQSQSSDCWICPRNNAFTQEYKILASKKMILSNATTGQGTIPMIGTFNLTARFPRGLTVRYTAGNASSITQGKVFLCYWANNDTGGSPLMEYYNRTYFVEG